MADSTTADLGDQQSSRPTDLPTTQPQPPETETLPPNLVEGAGPGRGTETGHDPHEPGRLETLWSESLVAGMTVEMSIKPRRGAPSFLARAQVRRRRLRARDGGPDAPDAATAADSGEPCDYVLGAPLGEGGMGVVHAARQVNTDRPVALKMLKPILAADADARAALLIEALVTAELDHPNIIPVHDLGEAEGNVFFAMKLATGKPWSRILHDRATATNLEILLKVCDAVAFAHSRGVVHRDLKPENVMVGTFGEVLVMDWGLAVAVGAESKAAPLLSETPIGGTPAYMAPEMAHGQGIGLHSDVYLLGAILFEIATGQRPHHGSTPLDCLRNVAANRLRSTRKTGELLRIARRALSTDPAERHPDVRGFQAEVSRYLVHAESNRVCDEAWEVLARSRQDRDPAGLHRAFDGFREALGQWQDNSRARKGLREAGAELARHALEENAPGMADHFLRESGRSAGLEDPNLPEPLQAGVFRHHRRSHHRRWAAALQVGAILAALLVLALLLHRRGEGLDNPATPRVDLDPSGKSSLVELGAEAMKAKSILALRINRLQEASRADRAESPTDRRALLVASRRKLATLEAKIAALREAIQAVEATAGSDDAPARTPPRGASPSARR